MLLVSVVVLVGCKSRKKDDTVPPVPSQLQIMLAMPPDGMIGAYYSYTLAAANGTKPYTWSIAGGSLPNGLTLNSTTGLISGTPTTAGTFTFTVMVIDSAAPPATETAVFSIKIDYPGGTLQITSDSVLPTGTEASAYSVSLTAVGGTTPYSWTITSGSLPAGLSLNSVTGQISGTPTEYGTFTFTVQVSDSGTPGQTDSRNFSLTINAIPPLTITTNSPLPEGTEAIPYSVTLTATGGIAPYSWSLLSGSLPNGLNLNVSTGKISGTPTVDSTFNFTVEVTDSYSPAHTTSKSFTLVINPIPPLLITTTSLPDGALNVPYSASLQAEGGVAPYTWSLTSGVLPDGLSLASNGTISGTPTAEGDFTFTVTVEDSNSPADSALKDFTITVTDVPPEPLEIVTDYLYNGMVGRAYNQQIEITGGTPVFIWSVVSGAGDLPPGLTLNQDGTITGMPTARGKYQFTVQVIDGKAQSETAQLQIIIESNELWIEIIPSGSTVHFIFIDSRERKWIALGFGGIDVFEGDGGDGMEWKHYSKFDMNLDGSPRTITEDRDGNVWVGGEGYRGITVLNKATGTWSSQRPGMYIVAKDILCDSKGRICFATYQAGTYIIDKGTWTHVAGRGYSIDEDSNGVLWLAGSNNTYRYDFGKIVGTEYIHLGGSTSNLENVVVEVAPDGKVWTQKEFKGIWEYDPTTSSWTGRTLTMGDDLGQGTCWAIAFDKDGNMWTKWKSGEIAKTTTLQATSVVKQLPSENSIGGKATEQNHTIVVDELNNKWMGSYVNGKIWRYTGN
jgi:streptogramin lyase